MVSYIDDIKLTVRDLLRTNWDNTGLPASLDSDDIHTGWYDDGKGYPQVTVTTNEEGVVNGGESGVTGLKGDGSGFIQHRNGTVLVDCWAGSRADYEAAGEEQLQVEEMARQAETILHSNIDSVAELNSLAVTSRTNLVDDDENPVEHRVQLEVTYNWTKD